MYIYYVNVYVNASGSFTSPQKHGWGGVGEQDSVSSAYIRHATPLGVQVRLHTYVMLLHWTLSESAPWSSRCLLDRLKMECQIPFPAQLVENQTSSCGKTCKAKSWCWEVTKIYSKRREERRRKSLPNIQLLFGHKTTGGLRQPWKAWKKKFPFLSRE